MNISRLWKKVSDMEKSQLFIWKQPLGLEKIKNYYIQLNMNLNKDHQPHCVYTTVKVCKYRQLGKMCVINFSVMKRYANKIANV